MKYIALILYREWRDRRQDCPQPKKWETCPHRPRFAPMAVTAESYRNFIFGTQIHLQQIQAKFVCQGHRMKIKVKVKVTEARNEIYERS